MEPVIRIEVVPRFVQLDQVLGGLALAHTLLLLHVEGVVRACASMTQEDNQRCGREQNKNEPL
jgi:hypothetical protein